MSIASMGGIGGMMFGNLSPFLSQIEGTQATEATSDGTACTEASSGAASPDTSGSSNSTTGTGKAELSSEILALLIQLQAQSGDGGTSAASSSNATAASATNSTGTTATSTTMANPITSLFSSMDANGDGVVSQSEFENYIENNLGGTQSEADALYSQLDQNSSTGLTEQQLEQDAQSAGPMGPPPGQWGGQMGGMMGPPSASQVADNLITAMGGSDGSVTQSQFEDFVTSNGGTTSEADQDFDALTSGSGTLTTSDLEQALETAQSSASQSASSTSISPILQWLNSLSETASGTPTA